MRKQLPMKTIDKKLSKSYHNLEITMYDPSSMVNLLMAGLSNKKYVSSAITMKQFRELLPFYDQRARLEIEIRQPRFLLRMTSKY